MKVEQTVEFEVDPKVMGESFANAGADDQADFLEGMAKAVYQDWQSNWRPALAFERQADSIQQYITDPKTRSRIVILLTKLVEGIACTHINYDSMQWYEPDCEDDVNSEQSE